MNFLRILFFVISASILNGQSYFQPAPDQKIRMDEFEILNGKLSGTHLQLRPVNKIFYINELSKYNASEVNTSFIIQTPKDSFEKIGEYRIALIKENVEALGEGERVRERGRERGTEREGEDDQYAVFKSAKPVLKYFYKDGTHLLSLYKRNFQISLDPLLDFEAGKEDDRLLFFNRRGLRIQGSIDQRVYFHSDIIESQASVPDHITNYITQYNTFPGATLYKTYHSRFPESDTAYDYLIAEAGVDFKISRHIVLGFGQGRQFIGSGFRSLFLSDFAAPRLYLSFNTKIWKLHYQNLFMELSPEPLSSQGNHLIEKKYMAAHYLSFNLSNRWNAGIFESVVFARSNGFELQYLNPVILYRFIEHSLGSPDNVFLGLHSNVLLGKRFSLYGQILFDEFLAKEFFRSKGWWANKFGFQLGGKYAKAFNVNHLMLQLEYNQVRPYTYTFRDTISNYAHYHQSLAHPLGANFKEWIFSINYDPVSRWSFNATTMFYTKGLDSTGINYGGNILLDYNSRIGDYGNTTTQGINNRVIQSGLNISYRIFYRASLDLNLYYRNEKTANNDKSSFWFLTGLRMNL